MDLVLLRDRLAELGQPAYRARQAWAWACRGADGYDAMTDLPAALREQLAGQVPFSTLEPVTESRAADGTVKALFRRVEAIDHCVFMGMGEPMLNLDNVLEACRHLPEVGVTSRRTAISTVGWIPGIEQFRSFDLPVRLALSLHAPDDQLRSTIMPVNRRYPLADVIAACDAVADERRTRVFVEYVMLAGVNDAPEQAAKLARLLDARRYKVNLIPYNPTGRYDGSSRDAIAAFKGVLDRAGLPATVRLTRGRDIQAACGQLAAEARARRGGASPTPVASG